MEVLVFGIVRSFTYILVAVGFSFVFGISKISNFAHGGFYVLSSFLAWGLYSHLGWPYPIVIVFTIVSTAGLGALMYWLILYRLRGQEISEVIATFSVGIGILEFFRWQRTSEYFCSLPCFIDGGMELGGVFIDYQRLAICIMGILLVSFLWFFTHRTKLGLACRGMAQERDTSLCYGIDVDLVAMLSLAIGSALVAVAAITISPLGTISINEGFQVIIFSLAIGVVGGLESTLGIIVASIIIGFAQTIVTLYVDSSLLMVVPLAAIVIVLAIKPSGLFGNFKELEERV